MLIIKAKDSRRDEYLMKKKKVFRILSIFFIILTFIGAGYVLFNKGEVSAGYAVIPSLMSICFSQLSITEKNKNKIKK